MASSNNSYRNTPKSSAAEAAAKGHGGNRTFLTQTEAAELLRISPRTLERMRLDSSGPRFVKAGRRVLYKASELEAWTESRTFQNTSEVMT